MVTLTQELIEKLAKAGLETFHGVGGGLHDNIPLSRRAALSG